MLKKVLFILTAITAPLLADEEAKPAQKELQIEQTLSIIKPDGIEHNKIGEIVEYFETAGLKVIASKMTKLSVEEAKEFYAIHKEKAFFNDLISYMTSGPVLIQVLEGVDGVAINRQVMGTTDPQKASPGTIRADFGTDMQRNAIHGSDSLENAKKEISFFFTDNEIYSTK